jgi:hypothetical protein
MSAGVGVADGNGASIDVNLQAVLFTPPWVGTDSVLTLYFFIHLFIFKLKKMTFLYRNALEYNPYCVHCKKCINI